MGGTRPDLDLSAAGGNPRLADREAACAAEIRTKPILA